MFSFSIEGITNQIFACKITMVVDMRQNKVFSFRLLIKISLDILAFIVAYIASNMLRYSLPESITHIKEAALYIPVLASIRLITFFIFRLYSSIWRYSSLHDLKNIIKATTSGTLFVILLGYILNVYMLSRFTVVMEWLLVIFFTGGVRLAARYMYERPMSLHRNNNFMPGAKRVLIYGAGRAGEMLMRNIQNTSSSNTGIGINVIGFVDDDPAKQGRYIHEKRVIGEGKNIRDLVEKYRITDIYFAVSALSGAEARKILDLIKEQVEDSIEVKTIPGLRDLVQGRVTTNQLRSFEIKDLLRRKPVHLDFAPVEKMIYNRSVMVVGGGGSIGQELCNQVARFNPKRLILLDSSEFNVYSAESFLQKKYPKLNIICLVADAGNMQLARKAFEIYRPSLVFHAAAYKHVPLMEANPWSAVVNNLQCTFVLTKLCHEFHVERFILISTDKAVQPSSIMGVTKRICEKITLINGKQNKTKFMAVRFGNVLGSSGSVIPKFKKQIEDGGPITITHPDITRYFMLISEAVELVLQAGAIGRNGNIYVLDMGEPIKIADLANYMINLSGLQVNEDIPVIYTGLRPGEKLYESLFLEGEESATTIPNLFVLEPKFNHNNGYLDKVRHLAETCQELNVKELRQALKKLIPEYNPDPQLDEIFNRTRKKNTSQNNNGGKPKSVSDINSAV